MEGNASGVEETVAHYIEYNDTVGAHCACSSIKCSHIVHFQQHTILSTMIPLVHIAPAAQLNALAFYTFSSTPYWVESHGWGCEILDIYKVLLLKCRVNKVLVVPTRVHLNTTHKLFAKYSSRNSLINIYVKFILSQCSLLSNHKCDSTIG